MKNEKAALVKAHVALLQRYELSPPRAAQLIDDIEPLNNAVLDMSRELRFEDEPAGFSVLLIEGQRRGSRRRG